MWCLAAGCLESMMERGNHADIVSFDRSCRPLKRPLHNDKDVGSNPAATRNEK